ncbi:MAG: hypothetical protein KDC38_00145 [Planctomycetes bacterium]|nr:hypothetical protein [Planctomycetota bacterium]
MPKALAVTPAPKALAALLTLTLAACAHPQPLTDEWRDRWIAADATPYGVRCEARVTIRSDALNGEFRALLVANHALDPRVRLQLYPDLGSKLLDLSASTQRIVGFLADGKTRIDVRSDDSAPRHFLTFLALTLLARYAMIPPDRVRLVAHGTSSSIDVADAGWPGHDTATAWDGWTDDRRYEWSERRHFYRHVEWSETRDGERRTRIEAPGLEITIEVVDHETEELLPPAIFDLVLPEAS